MKEGCGKRYILGNANVNPEVSKCRAAYGGRKAPEADAPKG